VQDVVPDLHVLEDLRDREHGDAGHPGGGQAGEDESGAAAELEAALGADDAADIGRVLGAAVGDDGVTDGVELTAELGDVGVSQVGGGGRADGRVAFGGQHGASAGGGLLGGRRGWGESGQPGDRQGGESRHGEAPQISR